VQVQVLVAANDAVADVGVSSDAGVLALTFCRTGQAKRGRGYAEL
jgi:hypothetical protein